MESIFKGSEGVGKEDTEFQHSNGEFQNPESTVLKNLVLVEYKRSLASNETNASSREHNGLCSSVSLKKMKTFDAITEREKGAALDQESVATTNKPNKIKEFTKAQELQWQKRLQQLREFCQINGHCRVPYKDPQNPSLGQWVNNMRMRKYSLTAERITALNNLGFEWVLGRGNGSNHITNWKLRFKELQEFQKAHGHCRVPKKYSLNPSLGYWVNRMRCAMKKWENGQESALTEERIAALDNLEFDWVVGKLTNHSTWNQRLEDLRDFLQTHGHCRVPQKYPPNPSLGSWVSLLRTQFKHQAPSLTGARIAALNDLGFDWFAGMGNRSVVNETTWKQRLEELREFHETNGHCRVPRNYQQNPSLGYWVSIMRNDFRKQKEGLQSFMTVERIDALNSLGFDWVDNNCEMQLEEVRRRANESDSNTNWKLRVEELREFRQTHGHCTVPSNYPKNPSLGKWASDMRRAFKNGYDYKDSPLSAERIAELNILGFEWVLGSGFGPNHLTSWKLRLKELRAFQKVHGHCRIPRRYSPNPSLGRWVSNMRREFKKRENGQACTMTAELIAALNSLGFDWVVGKDSALIDQRTWEIRMQELREFHQTNGHCRVPPNYPQNPSLGNWVSIMRDELKKRREGQQSRLTVEKIGALNNLGFDWFINEAREKRLEGSRVDERGITGRKMVASDDDVSTSQPHKKRRFTKAQELFQWQKRLQELEAFSQRHGHCRVPNNYPENPSLGLWASNTRMRKDSLSAGCIAELNNLGFEWVQGKGHRPNGKASETESTWKVQFTELQVFNKVNGHCRVPKKYQWRPSLGVWVSAMRNELKKLKNGQESSLTEERIGALNSLGFEWVVYDAWEIRLQELKDFKRTHGHCRVPNKYPPNQSLGYWVSAMRHEYKKRDNGQESPLTDERISALNGLGFDWVVYEAWEIRLQELKDFKQTHDHCRVPQRYPPNQTLGNWVKKIRSEFKAQKEGQQSKRLTVARIATLNNVGFDWVVNMVASDGVTRTSQATKLRRFTKAQEMHWETRLQQLREFHQIRGHCRVPRGYPQNPSLANWVSKMRCELRKREKGQESLLTAKRIEALNSVGFDRVVVEGGAQENDSTVAKEIQWQNKLQELREFRQIHGHCKIPVNYPENPSLGKWVSDVRTAFKDRHSDKQSLLTAERIAALNNHGFQWVPEETHRSSNLTIWKLRLEELREFYQIHGHCRVPQRYPQNPSFGKWASNIRFEFEKRKNGQESFLTEGCIAELDNLGFDWTVEQKVQEQNKVALAALPRHGSKKEGLDNDSFGKWVSKIQCEFMKRENGQESMLTEESIAMLNNLGFDLAVGKEKAREFDGQSQDDQQQHYHHWPEDTALSTVQRGGLGEGRLDPESYWV